MSFALFNHSQYIILLNYDELLVIKLNFSSGIFGIYYLLSDLNLHRNFFAIDNSSGAYCNNFSLLGFLFTLSGKNDSGLRCFFSFKLFKYDSVAEW